MYSNNSFLSFEGKISRKDYCINTLIVMCILVGLYLVNIDSLLGFLNKNFLYIVLINIIFLFQFVSSISLISLIYRRMANYPNFSSNLKKIYGLLYIFPLFYYYWGNYITDIFPISKNILDILTYLILIPLAIIGIVVLAIVERK